MSGFAAVDLDAVLDDFEEKVFSQQESDKKVQPHQFSSPDGRQDLDFWSQRADLC